MLLRHALTKNTEHLEGNRSGRGISAGGLHQSLGGTGEPRWSVLGDERGNKMIVACIHASNSYSLVSTSDSAADGGDRDDYEEVVPEHS